MKLSWKKRLAFNAVLLVITWGVIELLALVGTVLFVGSPAELALRREAEASQDPIVPGGLRAGPNILHPFQGAVMRADDEPQAEGRYHVTEYGFLDEGPPIYKRSTDRVIVAITGGSVARQLSINATDTLADLLSQSPEYSGRKIQFVRIANNGYKQPQQVMVLNYLLAIGAEFDVVINLDGFNEAVLPVTENAPQGINTAFPRDWGPLISAAANPEFPQISGYISYLRHDKRAEAIRFGKFPLKYSPLAQVIWAIRKESVDRTISAQIHRMQTKDLRSRLAGPVETFEDPVEISTHCVDLWARSSILMHQVCESRGIRYFHFLQPNQHVEGSKPISPAEAAVAVREFSRLCNAVRTGYPLMQARGPQLVAAGVRFTDLTQVFADHPEPLYVDTCCHVDEQGDQIMARAMAARIVQPDTPAAPADGKD